MSAYAFWNNKGGVGKSFLCFVAAAEYAHRRPEADVYVVDLCPQANVSETLLGGYKTSPKALQSLAGQRPRRTIAGYLEARLNSPFQMVSNPTDYVSAPSTYNPAIPDNVRLVCGDNLVEILSEAIRQTSQLAIPLDSWMRVVSWIRDLRNSLASQSASANREAVFFFDCNPSFAVYTQLALVAADSVVIPFTADDSSRRAIENVVALLYGVSDPHTAAYASIMFSKRAMENGVAVPRLHTFVSNRVTLYDGKPSKAFRAVASTIEKTVTRVHAKHRNAFADPRIAPKDSFVSIPDYHAACIVAGMTGTPLHRLRAGPQTIAGERVQINPDPLNRYSSALNELVDCF